MVRPADRVLDRWYTFGFRLQLAMHCASAKRPMSDCFQEPTRRAEDGLHVRDRRGPWRAVLQMATANAYAACIARDDMLGMSITLS